MKKGQAKWDFAKMKRKYKGVEINIYRHLLWKDLPYKPGEKVAFIDNWEVKTGYADFFNPCFKTKATISEGHSFLCISDSPRKKLVRGLELGGPKILDRPQLEDIAYPTPEGFAYLWNRLAEQAIEFGTAQVFSAQQALHKAIETKAACDKEAKKFWKKAEEYAEKSNNNNRTIAVATVCQSSRARRKAH